MTQNEVWGGQDWTTNFDGSVDESGRVCQRICEQGAAPAGIGAKCLRNVLPVQDNLYDPFDEGNDARMLLQRGGLKKTGV